MQLIKPHIKFIITILILSVGLGVTYQHIFSPKDTVTISDNEFPATIADWRSMDVSYDSEVLSVLSTDKIIYKTFSNGSSAPPVTLFMAYYRTLEKADFSHSPLVCFTGQGWRIEKTNKTEIDFNRADTSSIKVNCMIQRKLGTTMVTLFWYQSAKHALANRGVQKLSLFFDKLTGKSEKNAFVRLTSVVPEGKSAEEITANMVTFLRHLYPELKKYFL
jgi:EpsI family protein